MNTAWHKAPLGELLTKSDRWVVLDAESEYREVTVRLWGRGVALRGVVSGAKVAGSRRVEARAGEFIVSRIDARNGAFGLIPEELDGAVVTNDFPVFSVDEDRLAPGFLNWLSKTNDFVEACKAASEGTTNRVRLKEDRFLQIEIPLPPLAEQRRIVAKIERLAGKIEEAQRLREEATNTAARLLEAQTTAIFDNLGGIPNVPVKYLGCDGENPIQIGPFGAQLHSSEYVDKGVPVLNVGNVWPDGMRLDQLTYVTEDKAAQLQRYTVATDDLLFARSGATLGKVCLVPEQCNNWLMTAHLFRVRFDRSRCLPEYAFAAFRGARQVRDQVFDQVRGATRPGFNTTLLSRVEIPLPPVAEQCRIMDHLERLQFKIGNLNVRQSQTAVELDALLPAILDRAFKGAS